MTHLSFTPDVSGIVATAATRTIQGLAVPFNVPGNTSGGKVAVDPGAIHFPTDLKRIKLLRDHNRNQPVGFVEAIEATEDGLLVTFRVGATPDGDVALAEATEAIRDGLSVELSSVKRSPDGKRVVSAHLDAVALVAVPAFESARVSSVMAESDDSDSSVSDSGGTAPLDVGAIADVSETPEGDSMTENLNDDIVVEAAAAPQGLIVPSAKAELSASDAAHVITQFMHGDRSSEITAAFQDITHSANIGVSPAGWVGELWSGVAYQRQIVPLLTNAALTSYKVTGWKWNVKPEVADYDGDKAAVPSNEPTTTSVSVDAQRIAGGHDIDRKFIDFNDDEFIASYFRAMAESYARLSDERAAEFVIASATDGGSASNLLEAVAIAADQVSHDTRTAASYILVNPADRRDLMLGTTAAEVPAFLSMLGIDPSRWVASDFVDSGSVVVGAKPAATFYELGGSPIRVQAEHLANGGRDAALFGYYATLLHDARGIVSVSFGEGV